jgi:flagellin
MSFSVNTNGAAMAAIRTLDMTNKSLDQIQGRINSGLKVASAKDNASTFAIASGLRADIAGFKAVSDAISFGQATANVALKGAESVMSTLTEIKNKVTSAQSSTMDRNAIQNDIKALSDQLQSIVDGAQFNGVNLLNGTDPDLNVLSSMNRSDPSTAPTAVNITVAAIDLTSATLGMAGMNVATGALKVASDTTVTGFADGETFEIITDAKTYTFEFIDDPTSTAPADGDNIVVDIDNTTPASFGANTAVLIDKLKEFGFTAEYQSNGDLMITHGSEEIQSYSSSDSFFVDTSDADFTSGIKASGDPSAALTTVENALTTVKSALAALGTSVKQLETQGDFVKSLQDVLTEGVGTLVDANLAEESAMLQAAQTRQQLGIQALSIANQGPSAILGLFRGG